MGAMKELAIKEMNEENQKQDIIELGTSELCIRIDPNNKTIKVHYLESECFEKLKKFHPEGYDKREETEWVEIGEVTFFKKR